MEEPDRRYSVVGVEERRTYFWLEVCSEASAGDVMATENAVVLQREVGS